MLLDVQQVILEFFVELLLLLQLCVYGDELLLDSLQRRLQFTVEDLRFGTEQYERV